MINSIDKSKYNHYTVTSASGKQYHIYENEKDALIHLPDAVSNYKPLVKCQNMSNLSEFAYLYATDTECKLFIPDNITKNFLFYSETCHDDDIANRLSSILHPNIYNKFSVVAGEQLEFVCLRNTNAWEIDFSELNMSQYIQNLNMLKNSHCILLDMSTPKPPPFCTVEKINAMVVNSDLHHNTIQGVILPQSLNHLKGDQVSIEFLCNSSKNYNYGSVYFDKISVDIPHTIVTKLDADNYAITINDFSNIKLRERSSFKDVESIQNVTISGNPNLKDISRLLEDIKIETIDLSSIKGLHQSKEFTNGHFIDKEYTKEDIAEALSTATNIIYPTNVLTRAQLFEQEYPEIAKLIESNIENKSALSAARDAMQESTLNDFDAYVDKVESEKTETTSIIVSDESQINLDR